MPSAAPATRCPPAASAPGQQPCGLSARAVRGRPSARRGEWPVERRSVPRERGAGRVVRHGDVRAVDRSGPRRAPETPRAPPHRDCPATTSRAARLLSASPCDPTPHSLFCERFVAARTAHGGRVLLIEDMWVTGATAQSAAYALRSAGAEAVAILALGRYVDASYADDARRLIDQAMADPDRCAASCRAVIVGVRNRRSEVRILSGALGKPRMSGRCAVRASWVEADVVPTSSRGATHRRRHRTLAREPLVRAADEERVAPERSDRTPRASSWTKPASPTAAGCRSKRDPVSQTMTTNFALRYFAREATSGVAADLDTVFVPARFQNGA